MFRGRFISNFRYLFVSFLFGSLCLYLLGTKPEIDVTTTRRPILLGERKLLNSIEPFPKYKLTIISPTELNRTLDWLDLWKNDTNCTRFQVQLLEDGSHPEPGALVSFPGSGNSWLRMLLEGLTGVYINSVYTNGDNIFTSKGKYFISHISE